MRGLSGIGTLQGRQGTNESLLEEEERNEVNSIDLDAPPSGVPLSSELIQFQEALRQMSVRTAITERGAGG